MRNWMWIAPLGAILLLASGGTAAAQEKPAPAKPAPAKPAPAKPASQDADADEEEETVRTVQSEYAALQNKRYEEQRKNPPAPGVAPMPLVSEEEAVGFIERCWKIYDRSSGEPAEYEALTAILNLSTSMQSTRLEKEWREAIGHLRESFMDDPRMAELIQRLPAPRRITKEGDAFVEEVEQKSKVPAVAASLAFKKLQPELSSFSQDQLDAKGEKALAEKLNELAAKYGGEKVPFREATYAEFAKKTIYAMEHLKVGAVAPEIEAADLDGVTFKLSDYRGKAVMLDFWGYW